MILAARGFGSKPLDLFPHFIRAPEQDRARAAVQDAPGPPRAAHRREPLPLDPEPRLGLRKSASRPEPRQPYLDGGLDDDDSVQLLREVPGTEERGIQHHHVLSARTPERLPNAPLEERLDQRVQPLELGGVSEDDPSQRAPVHASVRREDRRPEGRSDPAAHLGIRQHLPPQRVPLDDPRAALLEAPRDFGLARGHEAGHSDAEHRDNLTQPCASAQVFPCPTCTSRGTLSGIALSITSVTSFRRVSSSASVVSKRSSSCTCKIILDFISGRSRRRASIRTMATLIRSAAEPWMGMLTATRSASARRAPSSWSAGKGHRLPRMVWA